LDGINRKELGHFAVMYRYTADDIISRVETARSNGAPLVIIGFHRIIPDSTAPLSTYSCRTSVFSDFLIYLKKEKLHVLALKDAIDLLCR